MTEKKRKKTYPKPQPVRTFGDGDVRAHVRLRTDTLGYRVPTVALERNWTTPHGKVQTSSEFFAHQEEELIRQVRLACEFARNPESQTNQASDI